jgi:hypothetical protein
MNGARVDNPSPGRRLTASEIAGWTLGIIGLAVVLVVFVPGFFASTGGVLTRDQVCARIGDAGVDEAAYQQCAQYQESIHTCEQAKGAIERAIAHISLDEAEQLRPRFDAGENRVTSERDSGRAHVADTNMDAGATVFISAHTQPAALSADAGSSATSPASTGGGSNKDAGGSDKDAGGSHKDVGIGAADAGIGAADAGIGAALESLKQARDACAMVLQDAPPFHFVGRIWLVICICCSTSSSAF